MLIEYRHEDKYDTGPIVVRRFSKTDCRFVSFTVLDPFMVSAGEHQVARIGFAEIELIADGKNVALNKVATGPVVGSNPARSLDALTDGNNYYGQILPLREWLSELASRHDLESELPLIQAELNDRYQRQKVNLSRFMWLAAVLGAGIIVTILVDRLLRQRAVFGIRERIAADVHDEIGANIHAIGLLSDLAQNASESPESLKPLMQRMRELTQRTGTAAAHCANMLESEGLFDDLELEMRRSSSRILVDLDHELTIKNDNVLRQLKSRKRIDLFLFHKECLINILRHSEATRVVTRLSAQGQAIDLTIVDNGIGMDDSSGNSMPPSLKRRARLLGAHALIDHPECSGTRIVLNMRINKRWILF